MYDHISVLSNPSSHLRSLVHLILVSCQLFTMNSTVLAKYYYKKKLLLQKTQLRSQPASISLSHFFCIILAGESLSCFSNTSSFYTSISNSYIKNSSELTTRLISVTANTNIVIKTLLQYMQPLYNVK